MACHATHAAASAVRPHPWSVPRRVTSSRCTVTASLCAAVAEGVCIAVAVTTGRYKTAVNTTCDASGASATAALTGSFIMGQTLEESTGAGDLALVDIHPMGCRPGTLA